MYAVIDIGSNTIRLSLYKKVDDSIDPILHKKNMVGLAGYITKEGELSEKGLDRAIRVLSVYQQILSNIEVKEVFIFATASLRNVSNTKEIIAMIRSATGFRVDVITGEQEAMYDYIAATHFMELDDGLLIDIGGGSTELVFYKDSQVQKALSLPIGSLSLYSKTVKDILPTEKENIKIRKDINLELEKIDYDDKCKVICGIGGTIRGAKKLNNELFNLPTTNRKIYTDNLRKMFSQLADDRKFAVQKIIKSSPDRIHTIMPGMAILDMIAKKYSSDQIVVSRYGVREGYLYSKLFMEDR